MWKKVELVKKDPVKSSSTPTATPIPSPSPVEIDNPPMSDVVYSLKWTPTDANNQLPLTPISPQTSLAPIDICKIPDAGIFNDIPNNNQRHFVSGFSPYAERAKLNSNPVIQFVTIDFPDVQGKAAPKDDLKEITDFLSKFWNSQSTNKIELKFRIPNSYIRMPKNVLDYKLNVNFFTGLWKADDTFDYVREAIKVADPYIDFSGVDVIVIAIPKEVTRDQVATFVAESSEAQIGQGFQTNEKRIYNTLVMPGPSRSRSYELLSWTHELGHNFGLTDLRYAENVSSQGFGDLGIYDLMNSMYAPELLAWNRFILGILNDDQVRCVNSGSTTHLIRPVEMSTKETKLVVIPTSKYKAIAIESRRPLGFDANIGKLSEGVIVYEIDTTIRYGKSPITIVPRVGSVDWPWRRDSALKLNDSVITQGWKISVVESGKFGDVIKVEKAN